MDENITHAHDFINHVPTITDGLSKREYFAAMAMKGILSNSHDNISNAASDVAENALLNADALINELNKKP